MTAGLHCRPQHSNLLTLRSVPYQAWETMRNTRDSAPDGCILEEIRVTDLRVRYTVRRTLVWDPYREVVSVLSGVPRKKRCERDQVFDPRHFR
jgi:hypothetical protein